MTPFNGAHKVVVFPERVSRNDRTIRQSLWMEDTSTPEVESNCWKPTASNTEVILKVSG